MIEHADIIINALIDYRNWFMDQSGNEEELKSDEEMVERINKAIGYVNTKVLEESNGKD